MQRINQGTPDVSFKTAEVAGVVSKLTFPQRRGDPTTFKIHCPNMNKSFDASCSLFCPIRDGDTIYALCEMGSDNRLYITRQPFVQPPIDRDSVIQCFMRALKQGYNVAMGIYKALSKSAGGDENVIACLTGIAQAWNDTHDSTITYMFDRVDPENITKLLVWWHKERNLRRLYLFGLTKKEINACRLTCDEIYNKCMSNPYTVPAIPIDKCDAILERMNKTPDNLNRQRGIIIRVIWNKLHESGWTGMPTKFLTRQFPTIKEHTHALKTEYGLVPDMETAYLEFPHKVEKWAAKYVTQMITNDSITYDTPLDTLISLKDGSKVERHSASFTRSLSEDQQRAAQGALDHNFSIVTGGAGTGKCLMLSTPILMYDGSIKKIQNIKVGEYVMGPDSCGRKVLSTCNGIDDMFQIIPVSGRSFTCNTPHVLTLKGIIPYVTSNNIVIYSIKGIKMKEVCLDKNIALDFINTLCDDIFDIPLDEFIRRKEEERKECYLYHTKVEFKEIEVKIDPYMIGYWLGCGTDGKPHITCADLEIRNYFTRELGKYNLELNNNMSKYSYRISAAGRKRGVKESNLFVNVLKDLNILNTKHIPNLYKINSRSIRMGILAGFIDAHGYKVDNKIEINMKNSQLAEDIEFIAFSLGLMITRLDFRKNFEVNGEIQFGIYQKLTISGDILEDIPVLLSRKKCINHTDRPTCLSFEVKAKGKGIYCGFELDGDGRFLLGDFLVTHNTVVLSQIMHNLELRGVSYAVCSFTGKAVSRIREVTKKRNPATIHRLIANARTNKVDRKSTRYEKEEPLGEYDHIIIDETSMVTTELMYDFVQAYPTVKKWTLVGDVNQLPPIGWGSFFQQLLKSETVPTYRLTTNYRVYTTDGGRDGIILNANAIISHDPVHPFEFVETDNFNIIEGPIDRVFDIVKGCFSSGIKADQIVILCPYNRPLATLNSVFQDIYNIGARYVIDKRGTKWIIGDRVMLTENDREIGVMNGETGIIRDITADGILVDFGQPGSHVFLLEGKSEDINYEQGKTFTYGNRGKMADMIKDGDEGEETERTVMKLQIAYAISIDKSQGSEWDFVIVYIDEFNTGSFLNRNRIYTALTRGKRAVWSVVSDIECYNIAAVKAAPYRCENLTKRLTATLPNMKPFKIKVNKEELEMNGDMGKMIELPAEFTDNGIDCDDFE